MTRRANLILHLAVFLLVVLIGLLVFVRTASAVTLFSDNFNRADSSDLGTPSGGGSAWTETETGADDVKTSSNTLVFDTNTNANSPIIQNTFTSHSSGILEWSFVFNWARIGGDVYEVWMQLGDSVTMVSPGTSDNTGVAINLKWAGTNNGMVNHEGFGFVNGATTTQVEVVNGTTDIKVTANLDNNTYSLDIDPSDGTVEATVVSFDNNVSIDAIRIYADLIKPEQFSPRAFDDIVITHSDPPVSVSDTASIQESVSLGRSFLSTDTASMVESIKALLGRAIMNTASLLESVLIGLPSTDAASMGESISAALHIKREIPLGLSDSAAAALDMRRKTGMGLSESVVIVTHTLISRPTPTPVPTVIVPEEEVTLVEAPEGGASAIVQPNVNTTIASVTGDISVTVPAVAVAETVQMVLTEVEIAPEEAAPAGFRYSDRSFTIKVYDVQGNTVSDFRFRKPVTITVKLTEAEIAAVGGDLSKIVIQRFIDLSGEWIDLPTTVDPDTLEASTTIRGTSFFALVLQGVTVAPSPIAAPAPTLAPIPEEELSAKRAERPVPQSLVDITLCNLVGLRCK